MTEPEPMQAGVVNVLLTIDPVASHAAGQYVTWDGVAFDEEQTVRCDAATPHELWAWTLTTDEVPGAAAGPRRGHAQADHDRGRCSRPRPGGVQRGGARALRRLYHPRRARPGPAAGAGGYRPYPVSFREAVLPRIFRDTVLPSLAGQERDEAVEILGHLEPAADAPDATA